MVVERPRDLEEAELEEADGVVGAHGVGGLVEDAVLAGAAGRSGMVPILSIASWRG